MINAKRTPINIVNRRYFGKILDVKNLGTARDRLQKALQYTLLYNNGTPIEFYYFANTLQVVLDQFVKKTAD